MSKWRDKYKVHPAADVFPMMSDAELEATGEDIKANGLREPLAFCWEGGRRLLCDGRNRMEAMERAGVPLPKTLAFNNGSHRVCAQTLIEGDPVAYVISANIYRRHLTQKQRAGLIVAALKAGEKPTQPKSVSKGGGGNVNELKAKAVAEGAKLGISKGTMERAVNPPKPKPQPKPDDDESIKRERDEIYRENEGWWRNLWRSEGRRMRDYHAGIGDSQSEIWKWRRAHGEASWQAEKAAWLRDHPGNPLPEHMCSMPDDEYAAYEEWQRREMQKREAENDEIEIEADLRIASDGLLECRYLTINEALEAVLLLKQHDKLKAKHRKAVAEVAQDWAKLDEMLQPDRDGA